MHYITTSVRRIQADVREAIPQMFLGGKKLSIDMLHAPKMVESCLLPIEKKIIKKFVHFENSEISLFFDL